MTIHDLQENRPLRLLRARGLRITCLSGRVWITAWNDANDYDLAPGETFIVPNDRLALVEAIGSCRVQLGAPGKTPSPLRLPAFLRARRTATP